MRETYESKKWEKQMRETDDEINKLWDKQIMTKQILRKITDEKIG